MPKSRVVETDRGIQGEMQVAVYDRMQRNLRDKGWIETRDLIKSVIHRGTVIEVGPGYVELEWLKYT